MEMGNQESDAQAEAKQSSAEKPKIKPSLKINPNAKDTTEATASSDNKATEQQNNKVDTNAIIMQRIKDLEDEQQEKDKSKFTDEAKQQIAKEVSELQARADANCTGDSSIDDRIKDLYSMYNEITESNFDELSKLVSYNLEVEEHQKLHNIVLQHVNKEDTITQKLGIIIRDLQKKTPLINQEVQEFVKEQKEWRVEKEVEFQKSIENIRSQMTPSQAAETDGEGEGEPESPESAMQAKYKELSDYVETMKKEVDQFKEAREKLIKERDDKIAELEDTKNNKLVESKRNIQEKIQALQAESKKLKKELPSSRKDYNKHKAESKKLVQIIEVNNKKRKELKEVVTKLTKDLTNAKNQQKSVTEEVAELEKKLHEMTEAGPDYEKVE